MMTLLIAQLSDILARQAEEAVKRRRNMETKLRTLLKQKIKARNDRLGNLYGDQAYEVLGEAYEEVYNTRGFYERLLRFNIDIQEELYKQNIEYLDKMKDIIVKLAEENGLNEEQLQWYH